MPTRTGRLPGGPGSTSYGPPVLLRGKAGLTKVCLYGPFQASQQLLMSSGEPVHRLQRRLRRL